MNLHSLSVVPGARKRKKRVARGRGSGSGKTAGRGQKGQMSRKGHKRKLGFEGGQMRLIRRVPKRGFKSPNRRAFSVVNVGELSRFDAGTEVTVLVLRAAGLVHGTVAGVKILGEGDLTRKLIVKAQAFSASARAKIDASGGACEVVAN